MGKKSKTIAISQVVSNLNVSQRTVRNWIKKGLITTATGKGRSLRISRTELYKLLSTQNTKA